MTIIVFDKRDGLAYSDSRSTSEIKNFTVVDEDYEKLLRFNHSVCGFAGNCESINLFFKKYKQGILKKTSHFSFLGVVYNSNENTTSIIESKFNRKVIYYIVTCVLLALFSLYKEYYFCAFISYLLYCVSLYLPFYYIKCREFETSNKLFFGSGRNVFKNLEDSFDNSFDAIIKVHIKDKYCNSNIKSIPINGSYWNEDIH
jgi:hypothetical protein